MCEDSHGGTVVTVTSAKCSAGGNEYTVYTSLGKFRISGADYRSLGIPQVGEDGESVFPCEIHIPYDEYLQFLADKLGAVRYLEYLLNFGDKSEKVLLRKLKEKEYSPEVSEKALELLKKYGVVDEESVCEKKVARYASEKMYGPKRIRNELLSKGFTRDAIDTALERTEVDFGEALDALCKKLVTRLKITDRKKLTDRLLRSGYGYGEVKKAVDKYLSDKVWDGEEYDY